VLVLVLVLVVVLDSCLQSLRKIDYEDEDENEDDGEAYNGPSWSGARPCPARKQRAWAAAYRPAEQSGLRRRRGEACLAPTMPLARRHDPVLAFARRGRALGGRWDGGWEMPIHRNL